MIGCVIICRKRFFKYSQISGFMTDTTYMYLLDTSNVNVKVSSTIDPNLLAQSQYRITEIQ